MPQRSHRATIATVAAAAAAAVVLRSPMAAGAGSVDVREPSLPAPSSSPPSAASSPLPTVPGAAAAPPSTSSPVPASRFDRVAQVDDGEVDTSDRPLVASVQKALRALGFDPGPVDGVVGPQTRSAVRAYQEARGRPGDGVITKVLLADLAKEITESR